MIFRDWRGDVSLEGQALTDSSGARCRQCSLHDSLFMVGCKIRRRSAIGQLVPCSDQSGAAEGSEEAASLAAAADTRKSDAGRRGKRLYDGFSDQ